MKIEVIDKKIKAIPYPRLMQSIVDGKIVLMLRPGSGVLLKEGEMKTKRSIGSVYDEYNLTEFRLFEGKITLENE